MLVATESRKLIYLSLLYRIKSDGEEEKNLMNMELLLFLLPRDKKNPTLVLSKEILNKDWAKIKTPSMNILEV